MVVRSRRLTGIWLSAVLMLAGLFLSVRTDAATASGSAQTEVMERINSCRSSIVRVEAECWDGTETVYDTKYRSGFVLAGNETGGTYVITSTEGLSFSSKEKEAIRKKFKLDENAKISEKITVIFSGDLRVSASSVTKSEEKNITVLKLEMNVQMGSSIAFSEELAYEGDQVYFLSFPDSVKGSGASYNVDHVKVTGGIVNGAYKNGDKSDTIFFSHNISADAASGGGALLNEQGALVGMQLKGDEAVSAQTIASVLDIYGIGYLKYEEEIISVTSKLPLIEKLLAAVIALLVILNVSTYLRGRGERGVDSEPGDRPRGKAKSSSGKQKRSVSGRHQVSVTVAEEKRMVIIQSTPFVIGRSEDCDLTLTQNQGVSRKHAEILSEGKNFAVRDLYSTNHTSVNGAELQPGEKRTLRSGDEIMVGREQLYFNIR